MILLFLNVHQYLLRIILHPEASIGLGNCVVGVGVLRWRDIGGGWVGEAIADAHLMHMGPGDLGKGREAAGCGRAGGARFRSVGPGRVGGPK